jgi:hypothetical protein
LRRKVFSSKENLRLEIPADLKKGFRARFGLAHFGFLFGDNFACRICMS